MPSPMALNSSLTTPSMFSKRKPSSLPLRSAASYLSAVSEMDARARARSNSPTPTSTPALSLASSALSSSTGESITTVRDEFEDNYDGLSMPKIPPTSEQVFTTLHSEFGHCANPQYRHTSKWDPTNSHFQKEEQEPPHYILISTYLSYLVLIVLGHVRDFFEKRLFPASFSHLRPHDVSVDPCGFSRYALVLHNLHTSTKPNMLTTIHLLGICCSELRFRLFLYPPPQA